VKRDPNDVAAQIGTDGLGTALDRLVADAPAVRPPPKLADAVLASGWPRPILFRARELPPFPVQTLPDWLREWVVAEARATETPVDLAAMLSLAVLAAATAKRYVVLVKPGWQEPLNLYTVTCLPSGNRKSAVFRDATAPLETWERAEAQRLAPEIAKATVEAEVARKRLEKLKSAAAGDSSEAGQAEREAIELTQHLAHEVVIPSLPRLICDDVTPEKLAALLAQHGGKMAVLSAEGGIFEVMAGRYAQNNSPNFEVFLKGHAGDTLRVDRVNRAAEFVAGPAVTMGLCVQPDVIQGLNAKPSFRGRGLLGRLLYAMPESTLGRRTHDTFPVPQEVRDDYAQRIAALLMLAPHEADSVEPNPPTLCYCPEGRELMCRFQSWLEPQLVEGAELGHMADWAAKLAGAVGRISGLLHLAAHAGATIPDTIEIATLAAAEEVGRYLIPHALAAYEEMEADPNAELVRRVAAWLQKRQIRSFTERDLYQQFRKLRQPNEREIVIRDMCTRCLIRPQGQDARPGPGRSLSPGYAVNPLLLEAPSC
jgi:hypothetical protein